MLFNQTEEQRQEMTAQDDGVLGVSFAFDWKAGHYEMAAGQGRPRHGCNRCCGPNGNGIPFTPRTLVRQHRPW